jgi:hypothetical protein
MATASKVAQQTTIAKIQEQQDKSLKPMKDIFLELASRRSGGAAASKGKVSMA